MAIVLVTPCIENLLRDKDIEEQHIIKLLVYYAEIYKLSVDETVSFAGYLHEQGILSLVPSRDNIAAARLSYIKPHSNRMNPYGCFDIQRYDAFGSVEYNKQMCNSCVLFKDYANFRKNEEEQVLSYIIHTGNIPARIHARFKQGNKGKEKNIFHTLTRFDIDGDIVYKPVHQYIYEVLESMNLSLFVCAPNILEYIRTDVIVKLGIKKSESSKYEALVDTILERINSIKTDTLDNSGIDSVTKALVNKTKYDRNITISKLMEGRAKYIIRLMGDEGFNFNYSTLSPNRPAETDTTTDESLPATAPAATGSTKEEPKKNLVEKPIADTSSCFGSVAVGMKSDTVSHVTEGLDMSLVPEIERAAQVRDIAIEDRKRKDSSLLSSKSLLPAAADNGVNLKPGDKKSGTDTTDTADNTDNNKDNNKDNKDNREELSKGKSGKVLDITDMISSVIKGGKATLREEADTSKDMFTGGVTELSLGKGNASYTSPLVEEAKLNSAVTDSELHAPVVRSQFETPAVTAVVINDNIPVLSDADNSSGTAEESSKVGDVEVAAEQPKFTVLNPNRPAETETESVDSNLYFVSPGHAIKRKDLAEYFPFVYELTDESLSDIRIAGSLASYKKELSSIYSLCDVFSSSSRIKGGDVVKAFNTPFQKEDSDKKLDYGNKVIAQTLRTLSGDMNETDIENESGSSSDNKEDMTDYSLSTVDGNLRVEKFLSNHTDEDIFHEMYMEQLKNEQAGGQGDTLAPDMSLIRSESIIAIEQASYKGEKGLLLYIPEFSSLFFYSLTSNGKTPLREFFRKDPVFITMNSNELYATLSEYRIFDINVWDLRYMYKLIHTDEVLPSDYRELMAAVLHDDYKEKDDFYITGMRYYGLCYYYLYKSLHEQGKLDEYRAENNLSMFMGYSWYTSELFENMPEAFVRSGLFNYISKSPDKLVPKVPGTFYTYYVNNCLSKTRNDFYNGLIERLKEKESIKLKHVFLLGDTTNCLFMFSLETTGKTFELLQYRTVTLARLNNLHHSAIRYSKHAFILPDSGLAATGTDGIADTLSKTGKSQKVSSNFTGKDNRGATAKAKLIDFNSNHNDKSTTEATSNEDNTTGHAVTEVNESVNDATNEVLGKKASNFNNGNKINTTTIIQSKSELVGSKVSSKIEKSFLSSAERLLEEYKRINQSISNTSSTDIEVTDGGFEQKRAQFDIFNQVPDGKNEKKDKNEKNDKNNKKTSGSRTDNGGKSNSKKSGKNNKGGNGENSGPVSNDNVGSSIPDSTEPLDDYLNPFLFDDLSSEAGTNDESTSEKKINDDIMTASKAQREMDSLISEELTSR